MKKYRVLAGACLLLYLGCAAAEARWLYSRYRSHHSTVTRSHRSPRQVARRHRQNVAYTPGDTVTEPGISYDDARWLLKANTGISRQAIRAKFGKPYRTNGNQEVYSIRGTSDGIVASKKVVVLYDSGGKSFSHYGQGINFR